MLREERANEDREIIEVLCNFEKQAASAYMRFKHITKENGSINNSTREINGDGGSSC